MYLGTENGGPSVGENKASVKETKGRATNEITGPSQTGKVVASYIPDNRLRTARLNPRYHRLPNPLRIRSFRTICETPRLSGYGNHFLPRLRLRHETQKSHSGYATSCQRRRNRRCRQLPSPAEDVQDPETSLDAKALLRATSNKRADPRESAKSIARRDNPECEEPFLQFIVVATLPCLSKSRRRRPSEGRQAYLRTTKPQLPKSEPNTPRPLWRMCRWSGPPEETMWTPRRTTETSSSES